MQSKNDFIIAWSFSSAVALILVFIVGLIFSPQVFLFVFISSLISIVAGFTYYGYQFYNQLPMKYEDISFGTGTRLIKKESPQNTTHCHVCGDEADIIEIEVTELVVRNKPVAEISRSKTEYCEDDYMEPSDVDGLSEKYDAIETETTT